MAPKTFADRPINKLVLFDVDGTLTPARQVRFLGQVAVSSLVMSFICMTQGVSPAMLELLSELRKKVVIGFVGGSDFRKISEQLAVDGSPGPP